MDNSINYDAFISYRRDNGFFLAQLVRDHLDKRGINAFLDVEELRSGEFDQKLYEAIQQSPNFILILPKGALDRCVNEDDWVRKEIFAAIKAESNIIPVLGEDFEWPRELYSEMPSEIRSLENYSGVKTSKDYLDAMIDRLISFMHGVDSPATENDAEKSVETQFITTETYFNDALRDSTNVETVDIAFHAGAEWFTNIEKNDLLYNLVDSGIHLRVLLNHPETAEYIAKYMRHPRKKYLGFEECLSNWNNIKNEYPDQIVLKLTDIPILRRYYSFHMRDASMDTVNVKYYTYGNANPDKNYQPIFYCDSPYFQLYRSEFDFLWEHSELVDNASTNSAVVQSNQFDTVGLFKMAIRKLKNISEVDMCFRAGSEWHLNTDVVDILAELLSQNTKLRVIVNNGETVESSALHMRQPLKKYYGYEKSLNDWRELVKKYPSLITVRVANVPLMRRYYNIKGNGGGLAKVSYYTYGNYNSDKDYQRLFDPADGNYKLYEDEFEYLWNAGSTEIR